MIDYKPSYLKLFATGELEARSAKAQKHLSDCQLCPHLCGVNRIETVGFCQASENAVIASFNPHYGEEAPLVGRHGSGAIFFGYCNMRCVFCQNCELSHEGEGEIVSDSQLAQIMLKLQNDYHCHNINLVSPTHFVPNILAALQIAVTQGLSIPLVYNCGGYENLETLSILDGVVDIYMPDFKYRIEEIGYKYSKVRNYPEIVMASLKEMDRQVGGLKTDEKGIAFQGLIIRHLVMPGGLEDTKQILRFISEHLSPDCLVNVMDQYHPAHLAFKYPELSKSLDKEEFKEAYDYARQLGLRLAR